MKWMLKLFPGRVLNGPIWPAALAVLVVMGAYACSLTQVDQSTVTGATTVTQQPPPTSATPAPGASPSPTAGPVVTVEVHFFGKSKGTPGKDLKVGEVGDVTASPYDAAGNDVGKPADPVAWACTGAVSFVQSTSVHYNGQATAGMVPGPFTCAATAGGVTGTLAGNVIP